ncbi:DUF3667 domain-containing protein [Hymenobacter properus]|uniref:DUF3667 domain-containing protein n=1 Tax=Hymenobacter properus TaxID=2791026 RepID=A0A931BIB0_9BACT|nr:DUF3667 domain-containing protein [Hymenobacter properus]MBF9140703.1 DUF3667 domain-containing protein [Hymenobacter properus]MBR7719511.1 DUF3667 domain-containing protein [Microvirga sp. SRT04]
MSDALHAPDAACLNCGHALALPGCFCPQCGQAPAHRLSTAHVLHEILHVFTHADKGIFAFIPQVLLHPGALVADYLAGRRKRHFNPFQFLLLLVGFVTLLAKRLHYYDAVGDYVLHLMRARHVPPVLLARVATYFHGLGTYFNVWWLALLPLHALVAWAVYGRRPVRLNYAESVLVQVVVGCAFQLWLLVALPLLMLLGRFPGASTAYLQGAVTVAYLVLVGRRGLGLSWPGALWRAVLAGALAGAINYYINSAAFGWYVFGQH